MKTSGLALLWAVATLSLLAFSSHAHAQGVFGRTSIGTTPSSGMSADFKRGSKFSLASTAALSRICAYMDGHGGGSGSQFLRYAVYRDNNGVPGAKVVETVEAGYFAGRQPDWICEAVAPMPLSPGAYWLMIHTSGDPRVLRYYHDGPADWFGNADTWTDGATDPFGNGNAGNGTISIFANYTEGTQVAGRTSVGTNRSGPMQNELKRASSFTLTGTGVLRPGAVYLDGLGGGTPETFVLAGVYRDSSGVPGELVARGSVVSRILPGQPGIWRSIDFPWAKLTPGKYWLALQTVGAGGLARYAFDGTGNWYGSATSELDVISDPFGAGFPGNGTISAFVSYQPGTFSSTRFGRTSVGSPGQGLKANYMRGSRFQMETSKQAALTALYAYLDGNGGATGSQAVRMALYYAGPDEVGPWPVQRVASRTVDIAAGRPPGWVRFPVPTTLISSGSYWIMIHSGDAAGVARTYGDGAANWRGRTDGFVDGADEALDGDNVTGAVTLSVYAAYEEFQPQ